MLRNQHHQHHRQSKDGENQNQPNHHDHQPIEETSLSVDEGRSLEIQCGASGKPEPSVKWYSFKYPHSKSALLKRNAYTRILN